MRSLPSNRKVLILVVTSLCASACIIPMLVLRTHLSDFAKGLATGVPIGLDIVSLVLYKLTMQRSSQTTGESL